MIEMKNSLETFNSRFEYTEDRIAKLEDRSIDSIQSEKEKEKNKEKIKQASGTREIPSSIPTCA